MSSYRVAVVGGGLGGLCLAHGLLKVGADVTVYERDASLAENEVGTRRGRLMFWLYRRLAKGPA